MLVGLPYAWKVAKIFHSKMIIIMYLEFAKQISVKQKDPKLSRKALV